MSLTITHATRTEVEVVADSIVALIVVGLISGPSTLRLAVEAVGITLSDLKDAEYRRDSHLYTSPRRDRPVIEGGPPVPITTAPAMLQSAGVERLKCGRCGHTKAADEFAMCSTCREELRAKQARLRAQHRQDVDSHRALVRAVAPATDIRLTEDKTGFELVCAACGEPIAKGQAVVCLSCFAGPRPAS